MQHVCAGTCACRGYYGHSQGDEGRRRRIDRSSLTLDVELSLPAEATKVVARMTLDKHVNTSRQALNI